MKRSHPGIVISILLLAASSAGLAGPQSWPGPASVAGPGGWAASAADADRAAVKIAGLLAWSRRVRGAVCQYEGGWAYAPDDRTPLSAWALSDGLARVRQSGTMSFDEHLQWYDEHVLRHPDAPRAFFVSDGTVVTCWDEAARAEDERLVRAESEGERINTPFLDKALGFDHSSGAVTPLYERVWRHRLDFRYRQEEDGDTLLYGFVPHYPAGSRRGALATPVTIRVDGATSRPEEVVYYDPAGFFPRVQLSLRYSDLRPRDAMPAAIARQVYRPVEAAALQSWLLGEGLEQARPGTQPDASVLTAFDTPEAQVHAWAAVRDRYGPGGPAVEPLGAPVGLWQPFVMLFDEVATLDGPLDRDALIPDHEGRSFVVHDAVLDSTWRVNPDGSRTPLQVDRRPYRDGKPIAQELPRVAEQIDGLPPDLVCVGASPADLGRVPPDTLASRTIELANIGDTELSASVEFASCGCLNPTVTPAKVGPGESCVVRCDVRIGSVMGPQYHSVRVRFHPTDAPDAKGHIVEMPVVWQAEVTRSARPQRLRARVLATEEAELVAYLTHDAGDVPDRVASITSTSPDVEFVALEPITRHTSRARFRVLPSEEPDEVAGQIVVTWADKTDAQSTIHYQVGRLDPYYAEPPVLQPDRGVAGLTLRPRGGVAARPQRVEVAEGSLPPGIVIDESSLDRAGVALRGSVAESSGVGFAVLRVWGEEGLRLADIPVIWGQ